MKSLADRIPAPTLVILAGLTVQLGSALAKSVFTLAGPLGTVFLRVALSAVLLFILWRPRWQATRPHWPLVMAYGGILALILVDTSIVLLQEPVTRLTGLYGSNYTLGLLDLNLASMVLGGGILLGLVGSWIAVGRHLSHIEPR